MSFSFAGGAKGVSEHASQQAQSDRASHSREKTPAAFAI